jgi:hypothetical protein
MPRLPRFTTALLACAAAAHALDPSKPPGTNFNLSIWTLQTPVASGSSVVQIKPADLMAGYTSQWLSTAEDGAMSFWCPVTGATTSSNTHYPRSELRETWPDGDWPLAGHHRLDAVCRVMQVPDNGRIIIGQIHGHVDGSEIIKLYWDNGKLSAAVEPNRSSETGLALGSAKIGDTIAYSLEMQDGKLKVAADGKSVAYDYTASTWKTDTYYFKAGAYVQDDTGPSSVGGRVRFYSLTVEHNGKVVRALPRAPAARPASARPGFAGGAMRFARPGRPGFADGAGRAITATVPGISLHALPR